MAIRPAQVSDLVAASKVCARAFWNDNLFGDLIHPHRQKYPDDMHLYWLKRLRAELKDPDTHILVAIAPDGGEVVGLGQWIRMRASHAIEKVMEDQERVAEEAEFPPNRAADPQHEDIIERCYLVIKDRFWTGPRAENWYLACLAVDPRCHGQGIGRRLVAFGIEEASKENVAASVISARGKDNFYQRCGFTELVGNAGDGDKNPLSGVEGGNIWFKDI